VFFVRRSSAAARRALNLAYKTGQLSYETARAASTPPVELFLTEIEYRHATARDLTGIVGAEARRCAAHEDADFLEVVVRGRLVSNLPREMLLTFRDHPKSGRTRSFPHRNQSVFVVAGTEVERGEAILSAEQEATFEWFDRRPRSEWIGIHNLHTRNLWDAPELRLPQLTWRETMRAVTRREPLSWARRNKINRSGFRIVCEPRSMQRIAAVWDTEIVKPPVEVAGRDEEDRILFQEWIGIIPGPLDDSVVHYRLDFDSTLAQLNPPKLVRLAGRSAGVSYPSSQR
jgi:hypothetical protein